MIWGWKCGILRPSANGQPTMDEGNKFAMQYIATSSYVSFLFAAVHYSIDSAGR
ncbi:hypothetical protein BDV18DRAFT_135465 [Aspergillus unguis]